MAYHMRCIFANKLAQSRFDRQLPFGEGLIRIWACRENK